MHAEAERIDPDEKRTTISLISVDPLETCKIGEILGQRLRGGDCVALIGELGSGKTCLAQGIARGIGIPDGFTVTSPTFTIINEYPSHPISLYHMDVYRLQGLSDLEEMGLEEYLSGTGVLVIEWAERIIEALPEEAVYIRITYVDEFTRRIEISGQHKRIDSWKEPMHSVSNSERNER